MENEIKFVHREETFNDHAVEELADDRAMCVCRLQFGRCEKSECESCAHYKHFVNCYSQMNDYDKTRLEKKISARYTVYSHNAEGFMSYDRLKWYYGKFVIAAVICVLLMIVCGMAANAAEYKRFFTAEEIAAAPEPLMKAEHVDVNEKTATRVNIILQMTRRHVKDLNNDGWVNCIDYAVTFKQQWDRHYDKLQCMIVRNRNPRTGMSHLFVSVWDDDFRDYVDVEPWTDDLDKWQMADVWGNVYDMYFNYYGEDYRWLGK